jgi:ubiquitin-protein ligase E3 A
MTTSADVAEPENLVLAAVAASCEHILALTDKGVLFSWAASNMEGVSGLAKPGPILPRTLAWPPQRVRCPLRIATIACGDAHSLALTDGGQVFTFGSNAKGQLGLGESVDKALEPMVVRGKTRGIPFRAVAAGMEHSMALTISGAVFAWGSNYQGCLGLGVAKSGCQAVSIPALVPGLPGAGRYIAAGGSHSAVIVTKGRLHLAGDNSNGQLGQPIAEVAKSDDYMELSPSYNLCSRSVALGQEHSLLLTYNGELHAFGRNLEGQCGLIGWKGEKYIEQPVRAWLPSMPNRDGPLVIWAIAAGRHHNVVLCSGSPEEDTVSSMTSKARIPSRRATAEYLPGRSWHEKGCFTSPRGFQKRSELMPDSPPVSPTRRQGLDMESESSGQNVASFAVLRPIAQPGAVPRAFMVLSVSWLGSLLTETSASIQTEMRGVLATVLSRPSVLNASFCYPGVRRARLDAAGLCKTLAVLCAKLEGFTQQLLEAAAEGMQTLIAGPVEDLCHGDQLRCLAVYLCLPVQRTAIATPGRNARTTLCTKIAHIVMRMTTAGRTAFRDLLAEECGDMRVLRDFLVPQVRNLADDAIRHVGVQPWLAGPLWEVVAQLQLQRALWQAVLLLQLLASACEHAVLLLRPDRANTWDDAMRSARQQEKLERAGDAHSYERSWSGSVLDANGAIGSSGSSSNLAAQRVPQHARLTFLDLSAFELTSLAEGSIPPELEFWLFQEHAQFHQITPSEVVEEPLWSDAAGMLPHRFCSFMAHANLVPIAFKQRVLQVENVLRQRLSQEQVLWPQAAMVLGGGRSDPAAFYFMLSVSRQHLLRDTFAQMYSASPVELRRPLRVEFTGEEAIDEGGVMREFFRLLSTELFALDAGLFVEADESRRLWFSPKLGAGRQLEDYWMVGVIVALAVYNNHPGMDVPLPAALFKKLKDQPTTHEDLVQLFPAHARSLEVILSWEPARPVDSLEGIEEANREFSNIFCMSYSFSTNEDSPEEPLCEGGLDRPVLFTDREEFAACVHDHLLHKSVQPQFESFARGFRRVCNSPLFDVLGPIELEAIVAGDKDLDFSRLQLGVQYEGYSADDPYIQSFWIVLEGFSVIRRRRFLAFCTGSDVAPAGGLQDLHLLIQKHGSEPTMRLPVAHTCFNLLLLPHYSSMEKLCMMLVTAIEWTEGFGLQ